MAKQYGAEVFFKRSEEYYNRTFDYLIDLDVTSPLRSIKDIINSFNQFKENNNDNLITAMPSRRSPYFNLVEQDTNGKVYLSKKLESTIVRRQDAPKSYDMNASIYIWKRDIILNDKSIFLEKTGLYVMPEERSIDIDNELDFEFVEFLMRRENVK